MKILKFGGSSLSTPATIRDVGRILLEARRHGPVIGVVLLTMLPTAFQFLATYKTLAAGILLVTALLYLPQACRRHFSSATSSPKTS